MSYAIVSSAGGKEEEWAALRASSHQNSSRQRPERVAAPLEEGGGRGAEKNTSLGRKRREAIGILLFFPFYWPLQATSSSRPLTGLAGER